MAIVEDAGRANGDIEDDGDLPVFAMSKVTPTRRQRTRRHDLRGQLAEAVTGPVRKSKHPAESVGQLTEEVTSPAQTPQRTQQHTHDDGRQQTTTTTTQQHIVCPYSM